MTSSGNSDQDFAFERLWLGVVGVRGARAGRISHAVVPWSARVLEAILANGKGTPMAAAGIASRAKADGLVAKRGGLDAALRQMSSGGLVVSANHMWGLTEPLRSWLLARAADGRSLEARLGVAVAGVGAGGKPPGRGNSAEPLMPGSIWVEEGRPMMKEYVPQFLKMRDQMTDDDLLTYKADPNFYTRDMQWRDEFIERRKAAGTWNPTVVDEPVPAPVVAPPPRLYRQPKGWPTGLITREQALADGPEGAQYMLAREARYPDVTVEMWINNNDPDSESVVGMKIIRAERQLAGTWDPESNDKPTAQVIRHPASPADDEPSPDDDGDGEGESASDEAFDNPHHGHEDEAEVIDSSEPDDGTPAAIMVEIDGVMSNSATMSHARLDQLIGQAHAGMVDCSPVDLVTMEAEFERRALAAGEEGLDLGEDRSWEG